MDGIRMRLAATTPEQISAFFAEMKETHKKKNAAYGGNAHLCYLEYGAISYAIRISDKLRRIKTIQENHKLDMYHETVEDTVNDAICYCFMAMGSMLADQIPTESDEQLAFEFAQTLMAHFIEHIPNILYDIESLEESDIEIDNMLETVKRWSNTEDNIYLIDMINRLLYFYYGCCRAEQS